MEVIEQIIADRINCITRMDRKLRNRTAKACVNIFCFTLCESGTAFAVYPLSASLRNISSIRIAS